VSSGLEHRECAESLGAYVLGALPEAESECMERHIGTCHECRTELEWLRAAADALPASVTPVEPPPELKARVMAIVQAEADLLQAAGAVADRPPRTRRTPWKDWLTGASWRPMAALGAAAAVAALVVVLAAGSGTGTRTIRAETAGPAAAGSAAASLTVTGTQASLTVSRLPAPAANSVDELWVKRGSAPPRPAGTFVLRSGRVALQRPVRPGDVVLVTQEPGRGTQAPTGTPFLVVHA
jgi:anti-sigma-K factor RskA